MHENHHAWVGASLLSIPEELRNQGADVLHIVRDRFSIDDARELGTQASKKPFVLAKRSFVLVVSDIAPEAQNALLKLFEEPPLDAQFFVVKPDTLELLPTLASRLMKLTSSTQAAPTLGFQDFARAPYKERLSLIAEKTKEKDLAWIEAVVAGCEVYASKTHNETLMREVVFVRSYIKTKGASSKMLLEALSLSLPLQ